MRPSGYRGTRARRQAEGVCCDCGEEPPKPNRTRCERCTESHSARQRERARLRKAEAAKRCRERRREAGLCTDCGEPKQQAERIRCDACLNRNREWEAYNRDTRRYVKKAPKDKPQLVPKYEGLLESPAPPPEKPHRWRWHQDPVAHLRRTG